MLYSQYGSLRLQLHCELSKDWGCVFTSSVSLWPEEGPTAQESPGRVPALDLASQRLGRLPEGPVMF